MINRVAAGIVTGIKLGYSKHDILSSFCTVAVHI